MFDLQPLRILRAVIAEGSFHGAATALGYSPSAISQQMSGLQRSTGLVLTVRDGRSVVPTAVARQLAGEAGRVFEALTGLDVLVADLRAGRVGTLTVGYFPSVGSTWIPPVIAMMTRQYPDLRLHLRLTDGGDRHLPDIEIYVEGTTAAAPSGYQSRHLIEDPYCVVVRGDNHFASQDRIPLSHLAEEVWIDNDGAHGPCRQLMLDACAAAGFAPEFRVETQDYSSAIQFVAEGLGITVLPRLGVGTLPPGTKAIPVVDPVPVRRIGLRASTTVSGNPAAERLVELLEEQARNMDDDTAERGGLRSSGAR